MSTIISQWNGRFRFRMTCPVTNGESYWEVCWPERWSVEISPSFLAQLDYTWSGTYKRSGNYTTISRHIIRLCPKTLYLQHFHAMFFHPTLALFYLLPSTREAKTIRPKLSNNSMSFNQPRKPWDFRNMSNFLALFSLFLLTWRYI